MNALGRVVTMVNVRCQMPDSGSWRPGPQAGEDQRPLRRIVDAHRPARRARRAATRRSRRPGTRQRRRRNASRNSGLVATDSARALNERDAIRGSSAQPGIRPQRYPTTARRSSRWTTTAASSVGATLNRPPGSSNRSSASKIAAISDVGRCCVNRPHMAGEHSRFGSGPGPAASCTVATVTAPPPPFDLRATLAHDGPLSRDAAVAALDHAAQLMTHRRLRRRGPALPAGHRVRRPGGDRRRARRPRRGAPPARRRRPGPGDMGGGDAPPRQPRDLPGLAQRRRRARARERPQRRDRRLPRGGEAGAGGGQARDRVAARLAVEGGRRPGRGVAGTSPEPAATRASRSRSPSSRSRRSCRSSSTSRGQPGTELGNLLMMNKPLLAAGRAVAAVDGDARPRAAQRDAAAPPVQHVLPVDRRPVRRAALRARSVPRVLPRVRRRRVADDVRVQPGAAGRRRVGGDLRPVRPAGRRRTASTARSSTARPAGSSAS